MSRPPRCRRICQEPDFCLFSPDGMQNQDSVFLTVDEYEVLRLVDLERLSHEQCAAQMDIARSTVTEIYESARYKLADCLVNGKQLVITGGHYRLCDGSAAPCRDRCGKLSENIKKENGGTIMKIAVTFDNGQIFQHFGHTSRFKEYEIAGNTVVSSAVVDTDGQGHGALASFLAARNVDALICGGIGGGAQAALAEAGIRLYGGVSGNADAAVHALLDGSLSYNPNVHCDHHDHEHGEGSHTCSSRSCGKHSCH